MLMSRNIGIASKTIGRSALTRGVGLRFTSTATSSGEMAWVDFFKIKKVNNRINIGASGLTTLGGVLATLAYVGSIEFDVEQRILGFDPTMVLGGAVCLGGLLGYLLGPFVGNPVFGLFYRRSMSAFKEKEKIFLQRIKANRVDPSSQSFSNPVPDYYGEKIFSLNDYKQWLRDCNAFRRKAKEFV